MSLSDEELIEYALIGLRVRREQIDRAIARILQVTQKAAPLAAPPGVMSRAHRPRVLRRPRNGTGT